MEAVKNPLRGWSRGSQPLKQDAQRDTQYAWDRDESDGCGTGEQGCHEWGGGDHHRQ